MDFCELSSYSIDDINSLISSKTEENIHLDFKASGSLDYSDKKKDEISRDISAFANSDGGVIVYGLEEVNHVASKKSYINGNIYTKEWLEQVITSKIQRPINDVLIYPIRENDDITKSIYVVKIPRSNNTPHMASDHRYYKRQNFKNVMMEEYEVRDLICRKAHSKLSIAGCIFHLINDNTELDFKAQVANDSNVVESIYKLNVYLSGAIIDEFADMAISYSPIEEPLHRTIMFKKIKMTAVGSVPLFPDECIDICHFKIESPNGFSKNVLTNTNVELILYNDVGQQDRYNTSLDKVVLV